MLTLIIPTYNRHYYLNRIFDYYSNSDFKVIIADGSDSPLDKTKVQSLAKNITYCYDKSVDPVLRMTKLLHLIDTPYTCMLSDDELHLCSILEESLRFLETHKDYLSCIGLPIGFQNGAGGSDINVNLIYPEFKNHIVDQTLFSDRLRYHLDQYEPSSIYGVQRTPEFKLALASSNVRTSCVYAPEIAFELASAVLGKIHVLQKVSWLRSFDNPAVQTKNWNRKFRFHHWFNDPKYLNEKNSWIAEISKLLSAHTKISISELNIAIESALNCYIEKSPKDKLNPLKVRVGNIKSSIKGKIKTLLKRNQATKIIFDGHPLTQVRNDLMKSDHILNLKDFDFAFSILQKYSPHSNNQT